MIKALIPTLGDTTTVTVVLGLSDDNVDRLRAGEPILLDLRDLGLPPQKIAIIAGETEESIIAELAAASRAAST